MAYCTRSAKKPSGYYAALHTRSTADLYSDDHAATLSAAVPPRRDEDNVLDRLITEKRKVVTRGGWTRPRDVYGIIAFQSTGLRECMGKAVLFSAQFH